MKRKWHFFIIGVAFMLGGQLLWSTPSMATDYYVDANGGNNNYSGLTPNNGFADLTHAMRQLQAGDTLYVRSGTYHDVIYLRSSDIYGNGNKYNSGTSAKPITVKAYQNETPVIGEGAFFVIEDLSWWVFEGLTFQNSAHLRFGKTDDYITPATNQCTATAQNITIQGNRFQHGRDFGIRIRCGRQFTIQNNLFDNLRSRTVGTDTNGIVLFYHASDIAILGNHFVDIGADGVHLLDREGAQFTNIVIMDNEFEIKRPYRYRDENGNVVPANQQPFDNVGENAIDVKQGPGPILISKNIIHGFRCTTADQDASGAAGEGIVIHNQASGIIINKNHFYDNQMHLNVIPGNNSNQQPNIDLLVHNNIFDELADPGTTGDVRPTGLFIGDVRNVRVFNNTFLSQYGDKVTLIGIADTSPVELSNNAFYNGHIAISDASIVNLRADYNAWAQVSANTFTGELQPGIIGANDIITNSLVIDPVTWEPLEGSPLIDAGLSIGIITSDYYDAPIAGQGHDIGAVEFTSSQHSDTDGDTIPDHLDNCTLASNLDQRDTDSDGYGNACDADLDQSGFVNAGDLSILKSRYRSADPDADFDGSGTVDSNDLSMFQSLYGASPGPSCIDLPGKCQ